MNKLRVVALVLALMLPAANHAASTAPAQSRQRPSSDRQPAKQPLDELDEVVVEGTPLNGRSAISEWFRRMVGSYSDTGTLTYAGRPEVEVRGKTTCIVFGTGPGLQCTLNLQSDDSMTNLLPGIMLFGFDLDRPRIRFMVVEGTGSAEGSIGELRGDTAIFRTECVTRGQACHRTIVITARPNTDFVTTEVAIELNGTTIAQYKIVKLRLRETSAASRNTGQGDAPADRNDKGPR